MCYQTFKYQPAEEPGSILNRRIYLLLIKHGKHSIMLNTTSTVNTQIYFLVTQTQGTKLFNTFLRRQIVIRDTQIIK